MIAKDTIETFGVISLAVVTCLFALALIIGFLFLPVKTSDHASILPSPSTTTAHIVDLAK